MTTVPTKEWMASDRIDTGEYMKGLLAFFMFVLNKDGEENLEASKKAYYSCPCRGCRNQKGRLQYEDMCAHLLQSGMDKFYTTWHYHGEGKGTNRTVDSSTNLPPIGVVDEEFDQTAIPTGDTVMSDMCDDETNECVSASLDNSEAKKESKYERLKRLAERPLFETSKYSAMDAFLKVNELKNQRNMSNGTTEGVLGLLKELLPEDNTLSSSYHEMKCTLKDNELNCVSYDVCVKNCMLFWKEHINSTHCPKCQEPRYKAVPNPLASRKTKSNVGRKRKQVNHVPKFKRVARKVMKYFPIIPRLQRLYKIKWVAEAMKWHKDAESNLELMRHPCDSREWRNVNRDWKSFAEDPRNVRLALAADGFKPYGQFGASYSCWPIILQPLNLPPSLVMSSEFSLLTILIPGKNAPKGAAIDVFLEPLIDDLLLLWEGVTTPDASNQMLPFTLKAMLLWCIHDFPAYGSLAGCSTSGHKACPICSIHTPSQYLDHSKKCGYLSARIYLHKDHPFRFDTSLDTFNGQAEHGVAPPPLDGVQIEGITSHIGSTRSSAHNEDWDDLDEEGPVNTKGFTRRSCLFNLPYWSSLGVRHNLDLMHIEKNVTELILNTILSMKGSKDTRGAREDLEQLGLKSHLWLQGEKKDMPEAPFVLSATEKSRFFNTLKTLRVPSKLYSNFWKSVDPVKKSFHFISHDYHVIMQHLLPALLMDSYPLAEKRLFQALQRISIFFNVLCSKVIFREHLIMAKRALTEAICILETYFPPAFFVSMVHLMHHLGDEALFAGPPRFRSMWPFERQIRKYKGWARNKRYIEGSIAEAYLLYEASLVYTSPAEEGTRKRTCRTFCRVEDPNGWWKHVGKVDIVTLSSLQIVQARRWVLQQQPQYEVWLREYDATGRTTSPLMQQHGVDDFILWLNEKVETMQDSRLRRVVGGPDFKAYSYSQFKCNGYTFSTVSYDGNKRVQNSGVSMRAYNSKSVMTTYYGVIRGIYDLDYREHRITVFYCDWVDTDDRTAFKLHSISKLKMVNFSKAMPSNHFSCEPFILASQASQVFYCDASKAPGWSIVIPTPQRLNTTVDSLKVDRTMYNSMIEENEWLCSLLEPLHGLPSKKRKSC